MLYKLSITFPIDSIDMDEIKDIIESRGGKLIIDEYKILGDEDLTDIEEMYGKHVINLYKDFCPYIPGRQELMEEIDFSINNLHKKIYLIKHYRYKYNSGLKEAKEFVENLIKLLSEVDVPF